MKAKEKKYKKGDTVLPGQLDENGKPMTPHTKYGVFRNIDFILRKMWQYNRILLLFIVISSFTQSAMRYLWSYIGKFVIDIVQLQASSEQKDIAPLIQVLIITVLVEITCVGLSTIVSNRSGYRYDAIRMKLITERIDKVLSMDYQTLEQPQMLDMMQRANNATSGGYNGVQGMMNCIANMGVLVVTMAVSAFTIISLDWRLIIALIIAMIINYCSYLFSIRGDKREYWDKMAFTWRKNHYMERCTQDFDYAKDIRLFSMKDYLLGKQREVFDDQEMRYNKSRNYWLRHSCIYSATTLFSGAVMYYILIVQVLGDRITIGNFTLYLGMCAAFSGALSQFYVAIGDIQRNSMQTDDYRTFMDYPAEEVGEFLDLDEVVASGKYDFEFKNVSFRYDGAEGYALKNLNLSFSTGKRLAVVGLNGAGKTTFIKLLLRLYDVTEGAILLNGVDIRKFRKKDYYRLFAPVFQNVEIFAFPMAENVSMQSPEATDRDWAKACLEQAGMGEKIAALEKGVDTELLKVIDKEGIDLSGGEKQKLALARALYKKAPVIVLDEPTAALDALAEYELYQNFDGMIGDKSAVYISHRLSSTRFCDAIAMFVAGEMVEYGTHENLLAKNGAYAEMFHVQAQYYENKEGDSHEE